MKKETHLTSEHRIKGGEKVKSFYGIKHFSEMGKKSAKKRLDKAIKEDIKDNK